MPKTFELTTEVHEILEGLRASHKQISSKYFYDDEGSRIFQQIMDMPEYYLTNSEAEIFELHKNKISALFCSDCRSVDLVELGAGDGAKTRILIQDLLDSKVNFRYIPVDISQEALIQLGGSMKQQFPDLVMDLRCGDYFLMIEELSRTYPNRKVVLFLGSNLGNFNMDQSVVFLEQINQALSDDDLFFIGLDLKKKPDIIRNAYDDPHGYTRDFNLNLLQRFNRELGANFNTDQFIHSPSYNPRTGKAVSYLVSNCDQEVYFSLVDETISFSKWETIFTEMSQKYDLEMIEELAKASGFKVVEHFFDSRQYFVNSLWKKE